ncbi:MAG: DedA family protein [Patescibacteria group bacterium]|nr:DedA family protein [Patescibacteria group bacterium]
MFDALASFITVNIAAFGYAAVVFLMGVESANLPVPSEIVLPYAGFLVAQGQMNFHAAALAGAVGCLWGSLVSYWLGVRFGRPFIEKHGRWFMLGPKELAHGDRLFARYGQTAAFIARLLPVVRTFISLIAGIWRIRLLPFAIMTFIGSWAWSYLLVYVGWKLGQNWEMLRPLWHRFDAIIISLGLAAVLGYVIHHVRPWQRPKR